MRMLSHRFTLLVLTLATPLSYAAEPTTAPSKVTAVTIYQDSALAALEKSPRPRRFDP